MKMLRMRAVLQAVLCVLMVGSLQGMTSPVKRGWQALWPAVRAVAESFVITPENFTQARLAKAVEGIVEKQVARPFQSTVLASIRGPMTDRATLRVLEKNTPESHSLLRSIGSELVKEKPNSPFAQQFKKISLSQRPARVLQEVQVLLESPAGKTILDQAVIDFKKTAEGKKLWPKLENSLRESMQDMLTSLRVEIVGAQPLDLWRGKQELAGRIYFESLPIPRSLVPRTELRSALQLAKPIDTSVAVFVPQEVRLAKAPDQALQIVSYRDFPGALAVRTEASALVPFKKSATAVQLLEPMAQPAPSSLAKPITLVGALGAPSSRPVEARLVAVSTFREREKQRAAALKEPVAQEQDRTQHDGMADTLKKREDVAKHTQEVMAKKALVVPVEKKKIDLELVYRKSIARDVHENRNVEDALIRRWVNFGGPLFSQLPKNDRLATMLKLFHAYNLLLQEGRAGKPSGIERLERVKKTIFTVLGEDNDWEGVRQRLIFSIKEYEKVAQFRPLSSEEKDNLARWREISIL